MPLLGGLFSKKAKANAGRRPDSQAASVTTTDDADHSQWSPTYSYVTPDTQGPSVANGRSYLHPDAARANSRTTLNSGYHSDVVSPVPSPSTPAQPSSSSKMRLPFGRKKSSKPLISGFASAPEDDSPPPDVVHRPPFMGHTSTPSAVSSDTEVFPRRLGPPPSRSAVFAAYADPNNALSTRSLPHDSSSPFARSEPIPPVPKQPKRPSLFAWTKSNNNKSLSVPPKDDRHSQLTVSSNGDRSVDTLSDANASNHNSSFNLKSFRHVNPASTSPTRSNTSNVSLATPGIAIPTPRPRGDSVYNSDSASQQRISVAAFREAQARRSMAGSPSPSMGGSASPLPASPALGNEERGQNAAGPKPSRSSSHIPQSSQATLQQRRKSGMSFAAMSVYAPDSDESEEEQEEEVDDSEDDRTYTNATRLAGRGAMQDRFGKSRAKSELGHGSTFTSFTRRDESFGNSPGYSSNNSRIPPSSKSHLGHGENYTSSPSTSRPPLPNYQPLPLPRSQTGLSDYGAGSRQRASNSTSALRPSAAAKRASVVAAANAANDAEEAAMHFKRASRHVRDSSVTSNPDESLERQAKKALTHLGHGPSAIPPSTSTFNTPPSNISSTSQAAVPPPSQSQLPQVRSQPIAQPQPQSHHRRQPVIASNSDSDSDNTPLGVLVPPRRPGSALSSYSTGNVSISGRSVGGTPHAPPKPLINIKELTGGNTSANRSGSAPTIAALNNPKKSMDGFTGGRTLLAQADSLASGTNNPSGHGPSKVQKPRASSVSVGGLAHMHSPPLPSQSQSEPKAPPGVFTFSPKVEDEKVLGSGGPLTSSPTMIPAQLTSKVAPFKFASPPGTPKKEEMKMLGLGMPPEQQSQEETPPRQELGRQKQPSSPKKLQKPPPARSATIPVTTPTTTGSPATTPGGTEKRDALTERLERVVKKSVSGDQSGMLSASTSPGSISSAATSPVAPSVLSANRGRGPVPATSPNNSFLSARQQTRPSPSSTLSLSPQPAQALVHSRGKSVSPLPLHQRSPEVEPSKPSPPDQSLADLLGAGIQLISLTGESDDEEGNGSDSEESETEESEDPYGYESPGVYGRKEKAKRRRKRSGEKKSSKRSGEETEEDGWEKVQETPEVEAKPITPIPIKQRTPLPSFSVTSRPQAPRRPDVSPQQHQSQQSQGSRQSVYSGMSGNASVSGGGSFSGASSVSGGGGRRESVASSYSLFGPSSTSGSQGTVAAVDARPPDTRKRSSTLIPTSTTSSTLHAPTNGHSHSGSTSGQNDSNNPKVDSKTNAVVMQPQQSRQRSSTMLPAMPQPVQPTSQTIPGMVGAQNHQPNNVNRPFAMRRDSPASSTGDSSSGRAPLTPRDGSDIAVRGRDGAPVDRESQYSGGASGLGINTRGRNGKQVKRRSVSFEEDVRDLTGSGNGSGGERGVRASREFLAPRNAKNEEQQDLGGKAQEIEERRKERRREEARAAIELGNVINGPGPNLDEDDDDMPINQMNPRMANMNSMMMGPMGMQQQQHPGVGFGPGTAQSMSPGWGMGNMGMQLPMNLPVNMPMNANMPPMNMNTNMNNSMLSPSQFMLPPPMNGDPSFMAAHQQAMMIAKQAYQMAVAQQAMAAAADEWERSSNAGGFGSGGSVYGGPANAGMMNPAAYGMMGQMQANNWSTGSAIFPSSRSMYNMNMSSSRSEYGGGMGGGGGRGLTPNWNSSRSSYGDLGPTSTNGGGKRDPRESTYGPQLYPNMPPIPPSGSSGKMGNGSSGGGGQRMRTTSQPATPSKNGARRAPPPSSWKAGA